MSLYLSAAWRRGLIRIGALLAVALAGFSAGQLSAGGATLKAVTPIIASGETIVGERVAYPTGSQAKVTAVVVTLEPGGETGWHTHGVPTLGYVLEGEVTVDYGEKGSHVYQAGDAILEAMAVAHNGRNTGSGRMELLAVFMGAEGLATSISATR